MTTISTEQVKTLRDQTGVSVMQCKKALEEAGGDMDKAIALLKKKSSEIAAKKSDRTLAGGIVASYIHSNKKIGTMIELLCETDFVANNPEFQTLASDIALHAAAMKPEFVSLEGISNEARAQITALFDEEVAKLDKPEAIKAKVLEGKVAEYFKERVLLEQSFVKDPNTTIANLITQAVQKFGEKIEVGRMAIYSLS